MVVFCGSLLWRLVHESKGFGGFLHVCMYITHACSHMLASSAPAAVEPSSHMFAYCGVASEHISLFLLRFPPCVMFTRRRTTVFVLSCDPLFLCRRPPHCHCRLRAFACRGYMVLWKAIFDKAPDLSRNDINIRTSTSDALHSVSAHHAHV